MAGRNFLNLSFCIRYLNTLMKVFAICKKIHNAKLELYKFCLVLLQIFHYLNLIKRIHLMNVFAICKKIDAKSEPIIFSLFDKKMILIKVLCDVEFRIKRLWNFPTVFEKIITNHQSLSTETQENYLSLRITLQFK